MSNMGVKKICFKTFKQQVSATIFPTTAWVHGPDDNAIIIKFMLIYHPVISQLALNFISYDSSISMTSNAHVKYILAYVLKIFNIEIKWHDSWFEH